MTTDDKKILVEMANTMFLLIHTKCEIATLVAKHQNAPKYLYEQAQDLQNRVMEVIFAD